MSDPPKYVFGRDGSAAFPIGTWSSKSGQASLLRSVSNARRRPSTTANDDVSRPPYSKLRPMTDGGVFKRTAQAKLGLPLLSTLRQDVLASSTVARQASVAGTPHINSCHFNNEKDFLVQTRSPRLSTFLSEYPEDQNPNSEPHEDIEGCSHAGPIETDRCQGPRSDVRALARGESRIAELPGDLEEAIDALREFPDRVEQELRSLKDNVIERDAELQRISEDNERLQSDLQTSNESLEEFEAQEITLRNQYEKLESASSTTRNELRSMRERFDALKKTSGEERDRFQNELNSRQQETESALQSLSASKERISLRDHELKNVQEELVYVQRKIEEQFDTIQESKAESTQLRKCLQESFAQREKLTSLLNTQQTERERLNAQLRESQAEVLRLLEVLKQTRTDHAGKMKTAIRTLRQVRKENSRQLCSSSCLRLPKHGIDFLRTTLLSCLITLAAIYPYAQNFKNLSTKLLPAAQRLVGNSAKAGQARKHLAKVLCGYNSKLLSEWKVVVNITFPMRHVIDNMENGISEKTQMVFQHRAAHQDLVLANEALRAAMSQNRKTLLSDSFTHRNAMVEKHDWDLQNQRRILLGRFQRSFEIHMNKDTSLRVQQNAACFSVLDTARGGLRLLESVLSRVMSHAEEWRAREFEVLRHARSSHKNLQRRKNSMTVRHRFATQGLGVAKYRLLGVNNTLRRNSKHAFLLMQSLNVEIAALREEVKSALLHECETRTKADLLLDQVQAAEEEISKLKLLSDERERQKAEEEKKIKLQIAKIQGENSDLLLEIQRLHCLQQETEVTLKESAQLTLDAVAAKNAAVEKSEALQCQLAKSYTTQRERMLPDTDRSLYSSIVLPSHVHATTRKIDGGFENNDNEQAAKDLTTQKRFTSEKRLLKKQSRGTRKRGISAPNTQKSERRFAASVEEHQTKNDVPGGRTVDQAPLTRSRANLRQRMRARENSSPAEVIPTENNAGCRTMVELPKLPELQVTRNTDNAASQSRNEEGNEGEQLFLTRGKPMAQEQSMCISPTDCPGQTEGMVLFNESDESDDEDDWLIG